MTRIHNVHEREIAAPAAVVGEILDTVGGADDRLWATDIWVAEPVVFDRPLGVGASGGHGSIRYSVLEYEPSRRIVFEFSPGGGLSGTHRFELERLGADRCRLRHLLEAETSRWMRPLEPILIGWHDAMVETALDSAPPASSSRRRLARSPRSTPLGRSDGGGRAARTTRSRITKILRRPPGGALVPCSIRGKECPQYSTVAPPARREPPRVR
jgi:hypothetical protein